MAATTSPTLMVDFSAPDEPAAMQNEYSLEITASAARCAFIAPTPVTRKSTIDFPDLCAMHFNRIPIDFDFFEIAQTAPRRKFRFDCVGDQNFHRNMVS